MPFVKQMAHTRTVSHGVMRGRTAKETRRMEQIQTRSVTKAWKVEDEQEKAACKKEAERIEKLARREQENRRAAEVILRKSKDESKEDDK